MASKWLNQHKIFFWPLPRVRLIASPLNKLGAVSKQQASIQLGTTKWGLASDLKVGKFIRSKFNRVLYKALRSFTTTHSVPMVVPDALLLVSVMRASMKYVAGSQLLRDLHCSHSHVASIAMSEIKEDVSMNNQNLNRKFYLCVIGGR